jgi:hypothetical protein
VERYVGGTDLHMSKERVDQVLRKCATDVEGGDKLEILSVEKQTNHASARTSSWKVTVPYSCRLLMENPALYPIGWTYRPYFAPRGDRYKRQQQQGSRSEALLREDGETETQRVNRLVEEQLGHRAADAVAAAASAAHMELSLA